MMKRIIAACFSVFFISSAFSQNTGGYHNGGTFSKTVEYNLIMPKTLYNVKSKEYIEKLFFGDFNAMTEFCYNPSSEVNPCIPSGFRIFRDSTDTSFILQVKYISNYREASKEASAAAKKAMELQMLDLPPKLLDSLPRDVFNRIFEYNGDIFKNKYKLYSEELPRHCKVEIKSIPISDQLAAKLHKKMAFLIDNFKAKGPRGIIVDGYAVTFRNVVDDEVWSLRIHIPTGNAKTMADLCLQIITDARADQLEESKYLSRLEDF
jgi:hypothetical protein